MIYKERMSTEQLDKFVGEILEYKSLGDYFAPEPEAPKPESADRQALLLAIKQNPLTPSRMWCCGRPRH